MTIEPDGVVSSGEVITVAFSVSEMLQSWAVSIAGNEIVCPSVDCACTWPDVDQQSGPSSGPGVLEMVSMPSGAFLTYPVFVTF